MGGLVTTPFTAPALSRPSVVLLAAEPLGKRMLGSAIRTYELGRALAPHAEVVLASPQDDSCAPSPEGDLPVVTFHRSDPRPLRELLERATAVVTQPPWAHVAAELRRSRARLIVD